MQDVGVCAVRSQIMGLARGGQRARGAHTEEASTAVPGVVTTGLRVLSLLLARSLLSLATTAGVCSLAGGEQSFVEQ